MGKIRSALISVSDKRGLAEFARGLSKQGVKIISTGGTAKAIEKSGIKVTRIEAVTGFPECLDGRVKTLHPKIHAGILAERAKKEHMEKLKEMGIEPIDLVVVNLYPFRETISRKGVKLDEAIENIDIGGPAMIRAAAKNHAEVAVIVSPKQYDGIIKELKERGEISIETRRMLAKEAFEATALYDAIVSSYLRKEFSGDAFPQQLSLGFERVFETRYGENPHQKGAFYKEPVHGNEGLAGAKILGGKELSFNNLLDSDAAVELVREFSAPAAVIVKHNNPCGAASAKKIETAFKEALECDPLSAFGSIIALNRKCNLETARQITSFFNEVVIAPAFDEAALEELKTKKNLRILIMPSLMDKRDAEPDFRKVAFGLLLQEKDSGELDAKALNFVSERKPLGNEIDSALFAWKVAKHVKSNAIVLAKGTATVGIGAGQMSRVDAAELAIKKSKGKCKGAVMASDAFFPFRDSIDLAAKAGISAAIEPGGSINDEEVIRAANEHGMALIFTGVRHFRH